MYKIRTGRSNRKARVVPVPHKIKYNGFKLLVRLKEEDETITDRTLERVSVYLSIKNAYTPSKCVGDKVSEHPGRVYVEVLSKWYRGPGEM